MDNYDEIRNNDEEALINEAFQELLDVYLASQHRKKVELITKAFDIKWDFYLSKFEYKNPNYDKLDNKIIKALNNLTDDNYRELETYIKSRNPFIDDYNDIEVEQPSEDQEVETFDISDNIQKYIRILKNSLLQFYFMERIFK